MKKVFIALSAFTSLYACAQQPAYKIARTYPIKSSGGWDYIAVNNGKIYVSHGTQVNILNEETGDSVGVIPNTAGVHGIAFDNTLGRGYTSNGRSNNVTVFDLKTNAPLTQIATGQNPDAIQLEPYTHTIVTCNGRSNDLTLIDPKTNTVVATIAVGGKPEEAASDEKGKLYVNLEDKNQIAVVDLKTKNVVDHWSLSPGEGPTGLAYDRNTHRLFAGCDGQLVVLNADNGTVVDRIKIGDGCDGVAFDKKASLIFTSNGEGTLSVIKEVAANQYTLLGNVVTKRGARTLVLDTANGNLFLPTADFETGTPQGQRPKMLPGTFQVLVVNTTK